MDLNQAVDKLNPELVARIKKNEGFKLEPYTLEYTTSDGKKIVEDFQTGGYGHKILPGEDIPTTVEGWEQVLNNDIMKAIEGAKTLVSPDKVPQPAFDVVTEMVFQMGTKGVGKFKKTLEYLNEGNYKKAAVEMLDSKWARQTPRRAYELSEILNNL